VRTIAVLNQKGGVGKTTTAANLAAALAMKGQQVLIIDLDPQAHLTIHYGVNAEADGNGAYEVLTKSADMQQALLNVRDNVWLLAANINLVGAESELVSVVGRETVLREAIESVPQAFDYVIIDCPPSLGLLTLNALAAIEEVFIPVQPHFLALQGFSKLLHTVTLVGRRINPRLRVAAILLCMFDTRVTLSSEVRADIRNFVENARASDTPWSGARVIPIHIRPNIKLAEAPSHGQTIFEYEPKCNGAVDYERVADYVHNYMTGDAAEEAFMASLDKELNDLDTTLESVDADIKAAEDVQNGDADEELVIEDIDFEMDALAQTEVAESLPPADAEPDPTLQPEIETAVAVAEIEQPHARASQPEPEPTPEIAVTIPIVARRPFRGMPQPPARCKRKIIAVAPLGLNRLMPSRSPVALRK